MVKVLAFYGYPPRQGVLILAEEREKEKEKGRNGKGEKEGKNIFWGGQFLLPSIDLSCSAKEKIKKQKRNKYHPYCLSFEQR